jgi:alpha-L-glutamate ligase-like protein
LILSCLHQIRQAGVLGMNRRNAEYIMRWNPRSRFPLVDNKVLTKALAEKFQIPTPPLYRVIQKHTGIARTVAALPEYCEFALKPARGSGGSGILLVAQCTEEGFMTQSGRPISWEELAYHISDILSGVFSLGGLEDWAVVERLIHPDSVFAAVTYRGVPDIRIIVYKGVPVMSMVRLPTKDSDGKANLHRGAIGAGIDLGSGTTLTAVHRSTVVARHPDTGQPVSGIQVPDWERMLNIAAFACEMTGLGYVGVDLVMDRDQGPMLLELNARPGLAIQVANRQGLAKRLEEIDRAPAGMLATAESRVAWAREIFSSRRR